jgi:hypothetical protein
MQVVSPDGCIDTGTHPAAASGRTSLVTRPGIITTQHTTSSPSSALPCNQPTPATARRQSSSPPAAQGQYSGLPRPHMSKIRDAPPRWRISAAAGAAVDPAIVAKPRAGGVAHVFCPSSRREHAHAACVSQRQQRHFPASSLALGPGDRLPRPSVLFSDPDWHCWTASTRGIPPRHPSFQKTPFPVPINSGRSCRPNSWPAGD